MTRTNVDIAETMQAIRKTHVETERDAAFERQLSRLFQVGEDGNLTHLPVKFTGGTETHGITFIEGSGGGKTTSILRGLSRFEPLALNPETAMPRWLHVKVESPATLRSLGIDVLKKLGIDKVSDRARVYAIWDMVRHRLALMDIRLVWFDESHDLFGTAESAETENMFKMLKGLMQGDHPVVLVLSGTERLSRITSLDAQVNRRFRKIRPAPLAFGTDNENLRGLVEGYASMASLRVSLDDEAINRLIHAGRHRFGRCIEIVISAIELALGDGAEILLQRHFADAWAEEEGCEPHLNVFEAGDWQTIALKDEDEEVTAEVEQAAKRSRNRRRRA